jgi:hypothetical protein
MWAPSLNASSTIIPAPGMSGFVSLHAPRCSSDRKKLRVVQSESQARRSSSARFPTQTMTPSAPGPGPDGSTDSSKGTEQWWHCERMRTRRPSIGAIPSASMAQHT